MSADRQDRGAEEPHRRIISDFYNEHDLKVIEFGSDSASSTGRTSPQSVRQFMIVNGRVFLERNPSWPGFRAISQKAFAACVARRRPCLKALLDQVSVSTRKPGTPVGTHQVPDDDDSPPRRPGWIDGRAEKKD